MRRILVSGILSFVLLASVAAADTSWPGRILLTNDNGIDDPGLVELARGLSEITQVVVVAATVDRSGTTNYMGAVRSRQFEVERRDLGPGITAYALDGYPADCVVFGLAGPMRDSPPDLVLSGINGGPNLADDWFGSGTIGAARTAAYLGLPAIALSGLDDDDSAAVEAVVEWVVRLVQSESVQNLEPLQYLTVSFPVMRPWDIEGVDVVDRARGLWTGSVEQTASTPDGRETWALTVGADPSRAGATTDVAATMRNRIAVVAMRVDESDPDLAAQLRSSSLPTWLAPDRPPEPECKPGLQMMIQDEEDEAGRDWGVAIAEILPGGVAESLKLQAGDVIVSVNGTSVGTPPGSPDDPVDVFVRELLALDCGDLAKLEYVRAGCTYHVEFEVASRE